VNSAFTYNDMIYNKLTMLTPEVGTRVTQLGLKLDLLW